MSKKEEKIKTVDASKVMASVADVVDFMKKSVVSSLNDATGQGKINLDSEELRKVCFYVEASMTTAFTRASGQIENSLK